MSKKIVYTVIDNGMDGMATSRKIYASFDENERDSWFDNSTNRNFYRKSEEILDCDKTIKNSISKLNAVEKLLLNIKG